MTQEEIKRIETIINKCEKCKSVECIQCEISYTDIRAISHLYDEMKNFKKSGALMNDEQAQQVLDELNEVRPEMLKGEAKKLFEAIMKIADNRDKLRKEINKLNEQIEQLKSMYKRQSIDITKVVDYTFELNKEIELKNKTIDLMSEMINNNDIDEDICKQMGKRENCNEFTEKEKCKACIKKYFENKAKEEE